MTYSRKLALAAGIFFVITFITSTPALFLYAPMLGNPDFILSTGADTSVRCGPAYLAGPHQTDLGGTS